MEHIFFLHIKENDTLGACNAKKNWSIILVTTFAENFLANNVGPDLDPVCLSEIIL